MIKSAVERSEFIKETLARLTPLKSTGPVRPSSTALVPERSTPSNSPVLDCKQKHILIEHGGRKIGIHEGDTARLDPLKIVVTGDIPEHCVGAGKIDPQLSHLKSVGILKGE